MPGKSAPSLVHLTLHAIAFGSKVGRVGCLYSLRVVFADTECMKQNKLIEPDNIAGKMTINTLDGATIVEAEVVCADDPGSQEISAGGQMMREIGFEFLRPQDAFIVRVDHTGSTNELFVDCRMKAGGPIGRPTLVGIPPFEILASLISGVVLAAVWWRGGSTFLAVGLMIFGATVTLTMLVTASAFAYKR